MRPVYDRPSDAFGRHYGRGCVVVTDPACYARIEGCNGLELAKMTKQEEKVQGLRLVLLNERGRLLRFLAARGAGDEAEDVFQDLWQRLSAAPIQPVAEPVPYLFRAAENLMRDRRRSSNSRERRQHAWFEAGVTSQEQPSSERALIAREQLREVDTLLASLGERAERVFRRYRLEGVGQATIAAELGVSLSSVEKDLQKAYRALAELKARFDAE